MADSSNSARHASNWLNLADSQDTQDPFGSPWPIQFAYGPVRDHTADTVLDAEYLAKLAPKRAREFSTGRYLASRALQACGSSHTQVGRLDSRAPTWPAGYLGSISHSDHLALVAACPTGQLLGLGVDIEQQERLVKKLFNTVFTDWEQAHYANNPLPHWADLVFSAKESIFKAINPIVGKFIGFQEVEVIFTKANGFHVRYIGDHEPNAIMQAGVGLATLRDAHVLTLFGLTASKQQNNTQ